MPSATCSVSPRPMSSDRASSRAWDEQARPACHRHLRTHDSTRTDRGTSRTRRGPGGQSSASSYESSTRTLSTSSRFSPGPSSAPSCYSAHTSPYRSKNRLMNLWFWFQKTPPWFRVGACSSVGGAVIACQISYGYFGRGINVRLGGPPRRGCPPGAQHPLRERRSRAQLITSSDSSVISRLMRSASAMSGLSNDPIDTRLPTATGSRAAGAPDAGIAPTRQVVQRREVFGEPQRMPLGDDVEHRADADAARRRHKLLELDQVADRTAYTVRRTVSHRATDRRVLTFPMSSNRSCACQKSFCS